MNFESVELGSPNASYVSVPEELDRFVSSRGEQITLVYNDPKIISQHRAFGFRVLLARELPEDILETVIAELEPPEQHYGKLIRGDSVVMVRNIALRDRWREEFKRSYDTSRAQDVAAVEDMAEAFKRASRDQTGRGDLINIVPEKVSDPEDHAHGGADLANAVREAMSKRQKG